MTLQACNLDMSSTYHGNSKVVVGNGASLGVSNIGSYTLAPNRKLLDVLVVPHLRKNLLSISQLNRD